MGDGFRTGLGVTRWVLDDLALQHAQAHPNVNVHEGEGATDVRSADQRAIEISTHVRRYRARLVVGADGLQSLVRRRLGLGLVRGRRQRYGISTHLQLPLGTPPDDYVCVHHNASRQWFTTPVGESKLQVALLVDKAGMKPFAGRLDQLFDEYLADRRQLSASLADRAAEFAGVGLRAVRCLAAPPRS